MTFVLPTLVQPRTRNVFARLARSLDPDSEQATADREREAAYADVGKFARHCKIKDAEGVEIAFRDAGWGWQFTLLGLWVLNRLCVVLKARQLGVSWLAAMFALWIAIRRPGQSVLIVSRNQAEAETLLDKVAYIYERLPAWRPRAIVNARSIHFPTLGSDIEAMPATPNVGRSRTAQLVILDEHAHQPFARQIFLGLKPVVEFGRILSISSGNGEGALHSTLYLDAKKKLNGVQAIFVPARAHPARQVEGWHERNRAEMSGLSDAAYTQEFPENDIEAITTTGNPVFDHKKLAAQPIEIGSTVAEPRGLVVYREPEPDAFYVIGADPAEGLANSDWSSASVLRIRADEGTYTGDQVAVLRGRWAPEVFAEKLHQVALLYGRHATVTNRRLVILAWERNNHGHAVRVRVLDLWKASHPYTPFRARDGEFGWNTTRESRTMLVDALAAAIRTDTIVIHDEGTLDQCRTFHENAKGRAEAQEGYHDDDVIAVGIAWQMRRSLFGRVLGTREETVAA